MKLISVAGLACLGGSLLMRAAVAQPLNGGAYLGPGNHTILIASSGNRICYQSISKGVMVSSVTPDPTHRGMYRLDGIPDFALYQPSANTLLYGERNQLIKAKAIDSSAAANHALLKKCLSSKGTFFKKSLNNRGG